ncbi:hypothetical protein OO17_03850 [Rhodopseudomonas palustris]|uniref:Uncharacterized protein n=2 Tax=Nitrobacteraceae TaxID=41294 RepID=A0A0D7F374_RHOPL|nr:hypothetical protein OO17_03850 [Rhodopseudomonas palustris]
MKRQRFTAHRPPGWARRMAGISASRMHRLRPGDIAAKDQLRRCTRIGNFAPAAEVRLPGQTKMPRGYR